MSGKQIGGWWTILIEAKFDRPEDVIRDEFSRQLLDAMCSTSERTLLGYPCIVREIRRSDSLACSKMEVRIQLKGIEPGAVISLPKPWQVVSVDLPELLTANL